MQISFIVLHTSLFGKWLAAILVTAKLLTLSSLQGFSPCWCLLEQGFSPKPCIIEWPLVPWDCVASQLYSRVLGIQFFLQFSEFLEVLGIEL